MRERIAVIVVAAGRSRRMGGVDKLWLPLGGRPLIEHTLAAFEAIDDIDEIAVVCSPETLPRLEHLRATPPWDAIDVLVAGGRERADSVYAGLRAITPCDIVLVHDAARPLVTPSLIRAGLDAARHTGAAIPVLPLTDTVKVVDAAGFIVTTSDRTSLRAVQTPQVFRFDLLLRAYEDAGDARVTCTDEAMLLERLGLPVATFPGDPRNVKVSTPADIPLVRLYMASPVTV